MVNRIVLNETSYFGRGAREKLATEIKLRDFNKIFLVTDKTLYETKVVDKVTGVLEHNNIEYYVFDSVKPNPSVKNVQVGLEIAKNHNVDCIVAVGGGSVIDTAKAISILMTNPQFQDVVSLDGMASTKNRGLPLMALPQQVLLQK